MKNRMKRRYWELKLIFYGIAVLFFAFLAAPLAVLFVKSFWGETGLTAEFYLSVIAQKGFVRALGNSFLVAAAAALAATGIAFVMAFAIHYTGLPGWMKRLIQAVATLPMFLPTITYGFAIIYSFGRQGADHPAAGVAAFRSLRLLGPDDGLRDLHGSRGLPADPQHHGVCG